MEMTPNEVFIQRIKCQNYKVCDELLAEHDKQARAEALDEFITKVMYQLNGIAEDVDYYFDKDNADLVSSVLYEFAEQLKENNK